MTCSKNEISQGRQFESGTGQVRIFFLLACRHSTGLSLCHFLVEEVVFGRRWDESVQRQIRILQGAQ
jgi:hypothetical protein